VPTQAGDLHASQGANLYHTRAPSRHGRHELITDVRTFLGMDGTMRIWIVKPLVVLTRKAVDFVWQDEHDHTMGTQNLKQAIEYKSRRTIFMTIDLSFRGVGYLSPHSPRTTPNSGRPDLSLVCCG
jgi:hypothetical protein